MYVRLVEFSGADAEKQEQVIQTMRENVVPTLQRYDGFAGFIGLYDGANGRAKAVLLWESAEMAETAEKELYERRRRISGGLGLTVESEDLYEAPVVELEKALA